MKAIEREVGRSRYSRRLSNLRAGFHWRLRGHARTFLHLQIDTVALWLKKDMEGLPHGSKRWKHFVSLNNGEIQSRGHDGTKVFQKEGGGHGWRRHFDMSFQGGVLSTPFWAWNAQFWRDSPGKRKPLKGACQPE